MHEGYKRAVRAFEGFEAVANFDYSQYSNGFGTRALYPGERIGEAEAHRRFNAEIEAARRFVDRHAAGWDEGTKAALTSLTFNAGTRWATAGLGEAVRSLDVDAVRTRFLAYTKANGVDLPGLVRRRLEEVTWIGNTQPGQPLTTQPRSAPAGSAAAAVADALAPRSADTHRTSATAGSRTYGAGSPSSEGAAAGDTEARTRNAGLHLTELRVEELLALLLSAPRAKSA